MIDQAENLRTMTRTNAAGAGQSSAGLRPTARMPRMIAVTSGKGGVGKTNIAANLGVLLAHRGMRTAILDADLGLSNVEVLLGCPAERNLGDVIRAGMHVADVWVDGPGGVKVISAGTGMEWLANLTSPERLRLLSMLLSSNLDIDALVIDTAPGISDTVLDFLLVAHEMFVVTTPEPTALMDSYGLIKTLALGGFENRIELTVNMAQDRQQAEAAALSIHASCEKFLPRSIDAWNWLPNDPALRVAVAQRHPIVELHPTAPVSKRLRIPAMEIMSRIVAQRMVASE